MAAYTALEVVTPATFEPVTTAQAKAHLRVYDTFQDDYITSLISVARAWAEAYQARLMVQQTLRWHYMRRPPTGAYPYITLPFSVAIYPLWYAWPTFMQGALELPRGPVSAVTDVSTQVLGQAAVSLTTDQYDFDPSLGRVRIHGGVMNSSQDEISIGFTGGYADPSLIPPPSVHGVLVLLAHLYEHRGDVGTDMPPLAKQLLAMDKRNWIA